MWRVPCAETNGMGRIGVVVQARMSSSRLPGKVLREVAGRPLLGHLLDRLEHANVDVIVVATSDRIDDDPVAAFAARAGAAVHRGPLRDVLARFAGAAAAHRLATVVRVCADSPLLDPALVDRAVAVLRAGDADLASNVVGERTFPPGQSVEAMTRDALTRAVALADRPGEREHVTRVMYRRDDAFRIVDLRRDPPVTGPHLAVDTPEDMERVAGIMVRMTHPRWRYGLDDILDLAA